MQKKKSKHNSKIPDSTSAKRQSSSSTRREKSDIEDFLENTYVHIIVLILVPLLLYCKVLNFDFIYDDLLIKNNANILGHISSIKEAFVRDAFFQKPGTTFYRPLQLVTFAFDCMISGSSPWMHHLTNIIIHIASVLSLYFLLRLLDLKKRSSCIASLIFSVHPLLAGGVSWVSSRGDLLIGFFGIWLFITMIYYERKGNIIFVIAHAICFLLAVFSKETASVLPILLVMFYVMFLRKNQTANKMYIFPAVWAVALLLFYWMRSKKPTFLPKLSLIKHFEP